MSVKTPIEAKRPSVEILDPDRAIDFIRGSVFAFWDHREEQAFSKELKPVAEYPYHIERRVQCKDGRALHAQQVAEADGSHKYLLLYDAEKKRNPHWPQRGVYLEVDEEGAVKNCLLAKGSSLTLKIPAVNHVIENTDGSNLLVDIANDLQANLPEETDAGYTSMGSLLNEIQMGYTEQEVIAQNIGSLVSGAGIFDPRNPKT